LGRVRLAAHGLAVEGGARLVEALRQVRGVATEVVECQKGPERRHGSAAEELGHMADRGQLAEHQGLSRAELLRLEERLPGKAGRKGEQLLLAARVVDRLDV